MRRVLVLALLLGGIRVLAPLGGGAGASTTLVTFGFLILAAQTVGELAAAAGAPKIVGHLVAGVLFGPSGLGVVSEAAVGQLGLVSALAIALIAFLAGAELRMAELRKDGGVILRIMAAETALTFAVLTALLLLAGPRLPFLQDLGGAEAAAFALVFAAVGVVHSPAVTLAVLSETGARGPVARTTLGVVLLSDVVVILLFSGALALARSVVEPAAGFESVGVGRLIWEVCGAPVVGGVLGLGIALYLRYVGRELILFAVLAVFFGLEITRAADVETLLALLVAGFVVQNASGAGEVLRHAMARSAAPLFVVFFALSGARIELDGFGRLLPWAVALALARAISIGAGTRLGARWAGASPVVGRRVGLGLVSQAGVAIGLTTIVAEAYPERGGAVAALLLAVIALNEFAGAVLFRRALVASGEVEAVIPPSTRSPDRAAPPAVPG